MCESPKDIEQYTWETKSQGHKSREIDDQLTVTVPQPVK